MKNLKKRVLLIILSAIAVIIIVPSIYYYARLDNKGLYEERLLEKFIRQHKRANVGFQTGIQISQLETNVSFKGLAKDDIGKINSGDREIMGEATVLAEVIWVGEPEPDYFIADLGDGVFARTKSAEGLYSVPARLRLTGIINDRGNFIYKTKSVKNLTLFTLRTKKYEFDFVIETKK